MNPIAIFRHASTEGPGYFATFLDREGISWKVFKLDEGEAVPASPEGFGGLVFMGGPMSVNDDLPWIPPVLSLIRQAHASDTPLLGHCLGGQLLSKALGGVVTRNPVREIGWGPVTAADNPIAREWLADVPESFPAFHWHGETFSLPEGAVRILSNPWCHNQAFVLGKHLGMQCHVEMTEELVRTWCKTGAEEIARHPGPSVQPVDAILKDLPQRVVNLNRIADRLYTRWLMGRTQ